jgi:hypothetical protein
MDPLTEIKLMANIIQFIGASTKLLEIHGNTSNAVAEAPLDHDTHAFVVAQLTSIVSQLGVPDTSMLDDDRKSLRLAAECQAIYAELPRTKVPADSELNSGKFWPNLGKLRELKRASPLKGARVKLEERLDECRGMAASQIDNFTRFATIDTRC